MTNQNEKNAMLPMTGNGKAPTVTLDDLENLQLVGAFPDETESLLFCGNVAIKAATAKELDGVETPLDSSGLSSLMTEGAKMTFTNPLDIDGNPPVLESPPVLENGVSSLNQSIRCDVLEIQGTDNGEERTVTIVDALVTFSGEITREKSEETDGYEEGHYMKGSDDGKVSFSKSKEDETLVFQGFMDLEAPSALEGFPVNVSVEQITIDAAIQYGDHWSNAFGETTDSAIENGSIVIQGGAAQYNADSNELIIRGDGSTIFVDLKQAENSISDNESVAVSYEPAVSDFSATPSGIPLLPIVLVLILIATSILSLIKICKQHRQIQELKRRSDAKKPVTMNTSRDISALTAEPAGFTFQDIQNIGKRPSQQDSSGCIRVQGGAFAVVADGMGGLSDGDKVSQKVVQTMLQDSANRTAAQLSENLLQLVAHANTEVNQMLGYKTYQSGSTLVAIVAERNSFRWVSIGDSRIYLYRAGGLLQINREHIFKQELLRKAVNRELTFAEAQSPEEGKKVTSFIGMGEIKYIDQCLNPVRALPGDRLMLCSDGVFNALSEREITSILGSYQDAASAAAAMEAAVLSKNERYQDNFSAVLFFYA